MQLICNIIFSYLIGSISGSMVLGKLKGVDIRTMGSGNAGGTNAFRTIGPIFALGVIIIDILKGYIAVLYISQLLFIQSNNFYTIEIMNISCGMAAVIGHVYPIYYSFQGGKGAGTLIGIVAALFPQCILYALLSWLCIIITTGYVGLASIVAGTALSISAYLIGNIAIEYFYFSISMSFFILFTHRSNIYRMITGEENQYKKAMIYRSNFKKYLD